MEILFNSKTREWSWLSNFYPSRIPCRWGGFYPTAEHAYQAAKSTDRDEQCRIRDAEMAYHAKNMGKVIAYKRPNWSTLKLGIMLGVIQYKFSDLNPYLKEKLMAVPDEAEIVHHSPWDTFWGVDRYGRGENHLGKIITDHRLNLLAAQE